MLRRMRLLIATVMACGALLAWAGPAAAQVPAGGAQVGKTIEGIQSQS